MSAPTDAQSRLAEAAPLMLQVLQTTLGNILSLGPCRALESVPMPYRVWAAVVRDAIVAATGTDAGLPPPAPWPPVLPEQLPRALAGRIVDEVFGGAIEDASVIEDIYRVIAQYANARWSEA
ncbi:MAG: hypothetical protein ACOZD0_04475 [Pseudomonadota bacterium]